MKKRQTSGCRRIRKISDKLEKPDKSWKMFVVEAAESSVQFLFSSFIFHQCEQMMRLCTFVNTQSKTRQQRLIDDTR